MSPIALPSTTAAILYGPRDIRVEDRVLWPPSAGHVQLKVVSTGLCGSDLHYYTHGRNGDFAVRAPLVLGHESAGIVTAVAQGVTNFKVGQRVAIEAGISCRNCAFCTSGRYNLCKGMRFCSSAARFPHVDGTLQTRMNHPAFVLHPLPDNVSFDLAALAEPLSVLIHAGRRIGLGTSPYPESVLVFGVGAIGLLACALARHRGARRVCAVDINPARLEFAKRNGFADEVYCLPPPAKKEEPVVDVCCPTPSKTSSTAPSIPHAHAHAPPPQPDLSHASALATTILASLASPVPSSPPTTTTTTTSIPFSTTTSTPTPSSSSPLLQSPSYNAPNGPDADGFDIVFECTGAESAIQLAILCAVTGGRVMLIGMGTRAAVLPVASFALREVDVKGSFRYAGTYKEALGMLGGEGSTSSTSASGEKRPTLPALVSKLITHRFPLEETHRAFEMLARGVDDKGGLVLKVMVGDAEHST